MPIFGQMETYNYKREINGVSEKWHKITLPNTIFSQISEQKNDIRIYGITEKDTIETPHLLRSTQEKIISEIIDFQLINKSKNDKGYYFTFRVPVEKNINQIELDIQQANFDWKVKLEGSQNQQEWFTVLENYRILAIQNGFTDYQFTKLTFSDAKYRYFRVFIEAKEKPELNSARLSLEKTDEGTIQKYPIVKQEIVENKESKQTEITFELENLVSVSELNFEVKDKFDFYRRMTIKALIDSTKTEKGWIENYEILTSGTLTSIEKNVFKFDDKVAKKFKIIIKNADNLPLEIGKIEVKGCFYEVFIRFAKPANYYLVYGKKHDNFPNYDIGRFTKNIPNNLIELKLGDEKIIPKIVEPETPPLFENELWLWLIMILIIALLGGFTFKMMKK